MIGLAIVVLGAAIIGAALIALAFPGATVSISQDARTTAEGILVLLLGILVAVAAAIKIKSGPVSIDVEGLTGEQAVALADKVASETIPAPPADVDRIRFALPVGLLAGTAALGVSVLAGLASLSQYFFAIWIALLGANPIQLIVTRQLDRRRTQTAKP